MNLDINFLHEVDGRWIANIESIPGVSVYGETKEDAQKRVKILALQVIADFIEHNEMVEPEIITFTLPVDTVAA